MLYTFIYVYILIYIEGPKERKEKAIKRSLEGNIDEHM